MRVTAPGGGGSAIRWTTATGLPFSARISASRGAWSEASTIRWPSFAHPATATSSWAVRWSGRTGSRQPNGSPLLRPPPAIALSADASDSQVSSSVRDRSRRDFQSRRGRYVDGQSFGRSPADSRSSRRSSDWRHRNSAASAMSPGSSRIRSVPGSRWSSAVAGQSTPAHTSAASPTSSAAPARAPVALVVASSNRARSAARRSGGGRLAGRAANGGPPRHRPGGAPRSRAAARPARPDRSSAGRPGRTCAGRRSRRRRTRAGPAVGSRAGTRPRCRPVGRTRRDRPPRRPARSRDRGARPGTHRGGAAPRGGGPAARAAAPRARWCAGGAPGRSRRGSAHVRSPRGERGDPGGRLVRHELAALPGERGPRLEHRDRAGIAHPRPELLGYAVADLRIASDPADPLAGRAHREGRGEVALGAVGDGRQAGVATGRRQGARGFAQPFAERGERAGRDEQRRQGRQVRDATSAAAGLRAAVGRTPRPDLGNRALIDRRRLGLGGPRFGLDRSGRLRLRVGDVEVDLRTDLALGEQPVERLGADPLTEPALLATLAAERGLRRRTRPLRARRVAVLPHGSSAGRGFRQPVLVRRMPSGPGGPSTSPGGASRSVSAGRSSKLLCWLAALFVPTRAHASTASAASSSSSPRRCRSAGSNRDRTWSMKLRSGGPMPIRRRLNFSVPSSSMIERETVVAAGPAAFAEAELAEGQREVVGHDEEVAERGVLAGEHLAHRDPALVHERERLDQGQLQAVEAPRDDRARVLRSTLARPAGLVGEAVEDHPADVVARLLVLAARVAQADDDLHDPSAHWRAEHAERARSRPGGPAAMVSAPALAAPGAHRAHPPVAPWWRSPPAMLRRSPPGRSIVGR